MKDLFTKYLEGHATAKEQEQILVYLRKSKANQMAFEEVKEVWKSKKDKQISFSSLNSWKKVESKVNPQYTFSKRTIISMISLAAGILILFGVALYALSIGFNGQQLSIHSTVGQLTEAYLPDSSKVFINSSSNIVYKTSFWGLHREIILEGEAFFDVSKKKFGSFDVIANKVRVHVTGTQFNVKAYPDEDVSVVLAEGNVQLTHALQPLLKANMKPGEMIVYDILANKFKRSEINISDYTSWKDGILYFENNKLPDILKVLERRYGVDFAEINDPILKELTLTFTIRDERLDKIAHLIASALPVKIETKDQIIYIKLDNNKYQKLK